MLICLIFEWKNEKLINKWCHRDMKSFQHYWPIVWGIHPSHVGVLHKGPIIQSFHILSLFWTNWWTNSPFASDLRQNDAHVIKSMKSQLQPAQTLFTGTITAHQGYRIRLNVPQNLQWPHLSITLSWLFWCWDWNNPGKLGQYRSCWCHGSFHCQIFNSHDIDYER